MINNFRIPIMNLKNVSSMRTLLVSKLIYIYIYKLSKNLGSVDYFFRDQMQKASVPSCSMRLVCLEGEPKSVNEKLGLR